MSNGRRVEWEDLTGGAMRNEWMGERDGEEQRESGVHGSESGTGMKGRREWMGWRIGLRPEIEGGGPESMEGDLGDIRRLGLG